MKIFTKIKEWFKGINWKEVTVYAVQATLNCIAGVIIGYIFGWNKACDHCLEEVENILDNAGEADKLMNENNRFIDEFATKHQDVTSENLSEVLLEYETKSYETFINTFKELNGKD